MLPQLHLDADLRYWVLLPITFVMVTSGILRQYVAVLLEAGPKRVAWKKACEQSHLQRARAFCANGNTVLSQLQFAARQAELSTGLSSLRYLAETPSDEPANPLSDPNMLDAMLGMLKGQLANFVPQTVLMWWVNMFFAGFVVMRLPFPLTVRFKQMLQAGVMTPDLDVSWVLLISWYFALMFGLRPVFALVMGDGGAAVQTMLPMPAVPAMPGGPKPEEVMKAEAENVQVAEWTPHTVAERVLARYQ